MADSEQMEKDDPQPYEPDSAVDITPNKDGGVLKKILHEGEGEESPLRGSTTVVHYVGTLAEDGSQFDSSRDRGDRFEFSLGKGEVIKAWDLGVATMKRGELARFICRSDYAYGDSGQPPKIPPKATLIFEIELFDWQSEDLTSKKDGGITRRNIVPGEGLPTPKDGAMVDVQLIGRADGTVFDERSVKFPLGEGTEYDIPEGLEKALEKFKKHEKSLITLTPKYAFGSAGNAKLGVPPGVNVEYEVELRNFEKAKEFWELDQEEKIDQAKVYKEKGTVYFKQDKFRLAVKQYKKIIDYLQHDSGLDEEKKAESQGILLAGHLNLSMCYLKLKEFTTAKDHADKAIAIDANSVKANFRRGQALLNLGEAEEALQVFRKVLRLDKTNKAAVQQIKMCTDKIKAQKEKDKKLYGGMFDKFAKIDAKRAAAAAKQNDVMSGTLGEWNQSDEKQSTASDDRDADDASQDRDESDDLSQSDDMSPNEEDPPQNVEVLTEINEM